MGGRERTRRSSMNKQATCVPCPCKVRRYGCAPLFSIIRGRENREEEEEEKEGKRESEKVRRRHFHFFSTFSFRARESKNHRYAPQGSRGLRVRQRQLPRAPTAQWLELRRKFWSRKEELRGEEEAPAVPSWRHRRRSVFDFAGRQVPRERGSEPPRERGRPGAAHDDGGHGRGRGEEVKRERGRER